MPPRLRAIRKSWDLDRIWTALKQLYPVQVTLDDILDESGGDIGGLSARPVEG